MPMPSNKPKVSQTPPSAHIPTELSVRLGSGSEIPYVFDPTAQRFNSLSGEQKVLQNMLLCLKTPVNRRLGQADYGSELPYMVFEPYNPETRGEMIRATKDALKAWVPKIVVTRVDVQMDPLNDYTVQIVIQFFFRGLSSTESIQIDISTRDSVRFPPGTFRINGVPLIRRG